MQKRHKQLVTLATAFAITGVLGSAAYFSNQDLITNVFGVAGANALVDPEAGIEIWEDFANGDGNDGYFNYDTPTNPNGKPAPATNVLPGTILDKKVQIRSTVNYNQFVRVSFDKYYTVKVNDTQYKIQKVYVNSTLIDPDLKVTGYQLEGGSYLLVDGTTSSTIPSGNEHTLNPDYIIPTFANSDKWQAVANDPATTLPGTDYGYFYYSEILPAYGTTSDVLASVQLSKEVTNVYKSLGFNVDVYAQAIQATQEVLESEWQLSTVKPPTLVTPTP
ncbi:MAG: hypothetical protein ACRC6H_02325 [Culicoidibacterales bacterium]